VPHQFRRFSALLLVAMLAALLPAARPAFAQNYTVTSNADTAGTCEATPNNCTLRQALTAANASAGPDVITFAAGVTTIQPTTELPALTGGGITINGELAGGVRVVLDGSLPNSAHGLRITSANNEVRSLVIINFRGTLDALGGSGIYIAGAGATGNKIYNSYIGVDATGNTAAANSRYGVSFDSGASNNDVGGAAAGQGNVIAANLVGNITLSGVSGGGFLSNNRIVGNRIGTNAAATGTPSGVATNQLQAGIFVERNARGTVIGPGNVIGGHAGNTVVAGIILASGSLSNDETLPRDTSIIGNDIGVSPAGVAIPNRIGISLSSGATFGAINTTIGNPADLAGGRNYIAGNQQQGIAIQDALSGLVVGDTTIAGNYIGIDRSGDTEPNGDDGIYIGRNGTGAETTVGPGNVISSNKGAGVLIRSNNNVIKGNFVGTSPDGSTSSPSDAAVEGLANANASVFIENGTGNLIGGPTTADRNVIAYGGSLGRFGVLLRPGTGLAVSGNTVRGNYIGLRAAGDAGLITPITSVNTNSDGVYIDNSAGNTISNNVVSAVGRAITVINASGGNTISTNFVGTRANGSTSALDKVGVRFDGIRILGGSNSTVSNNIVAFAGNDSATFTIFHGIRVSGAAASNNDIIGNTLIGNGAATGDGVRVDTATQITISQNKTSGNGAAAGDGIRLTNNGNNNLAPPAYTIALGPPPTISGTAAGCANCTVEVFTSAALENGEGPIYLTSGTTNGSGAFNINVAGCSRYLTITLTDGNGNTSPFSEPMQDIGASFATVCSAGGGFTLSPASPNALEIQPGQTATYTHRLTNNDAVARTYTIIVNSTQGWATFPATVNVPANSFADFNVVVTAPAGAADGTVDVTTVKAQLAGVDSAVQTDTTTVKAAAQTPANPAISPAQSRTITPPAVPQVITFNHTVTNTGQLAGNFTITAVFDGPANGFTGLNVNPAAINPLNGGASQPVAVQVTAPANAVAGQVKIKITVTVGTVSVTVTDTITVSAVTGFTFTAVAPTARTTAPGVTVVFTHTLVNIGNATDSFQVSATPQTPLTIASIAPANPISLGPGASAQVQVRVSVPGNTPITGANPPYNISVTARRVASATPSVTNQNQITVVGGGAPAITPGAPTPATAPANTASTVTFVNTLRNSGNAAAAFNLATPTVAGVPAGWSAAIIATTCPTPPTTLAANATCTFTVRVNVPATANAGPQVINIGATALNASGNVSVSEVNTVTVAAARALLFLPTPQSASEQPGQVVTYTHTLTNTGNGPDSFTLSFTRSDNSWPVAVSPITLTNLARGEARTVTVVVTIPVNAAGNSSMTTTVTATSQGNTSVQASVVDTTTARERQGAILSPGVDRNIENADTATSVIFTHLVTNTGNIATSFIVTASNSIAAWPTPVVTPATTPQIAPGLATSVNITVQVPAGTPVGTLNRVLVQVFANLEEPALDEAENSVRIGPQYAVLITPKLNTGQVLPNTTAFFTHTLTNIGTRQDSYQLSTSDSNGWSTAVTPALVDLGPGQSTIITVTVKVPDGLRLGFPGFTRVRATSLARPATVGDTATEEPTVGQVAEVDLSAAQVINVTPRSGEVTLNSLKLENLGSGPDTFDLTASDDLRWTISIDPRSVSIAALSDYPVVQVKVRVPTNIVPGTVNRVRITATSRFNPEVSSTIEAIFVYNEGYIGPPLLRKLYLPMVRN
jgi:uncharacterized membrane protein